MNRCLNSLFLFRPITVILTLLLGFSTASYAQEEISRDTVTRAFYDTLRVRAEKRRLTRLLYDIIVVTPPSGVDLKNNLGSTRPFIQYEGMVIRKREIMRLNAFGTNIDDPIFYDPAKFEKILNSTYTKSRSFVLGKYMLFNVGDTISSLEMSDNERLLRNLPFIEDARILIIPAGENQADVVIVIRETYPLGLEVRLDDFTRGKVTFLNRNFAGFGHEWDISVPYNFKEYSYPGIGTRYAVKNIARTFANLELDFSDGLGSNTLGGVFSRTFISSDTKYAWSATARLTNTTEDLDTMLVPVPLRFTYQDYWVARSFLLDRARVTRLIFSTRYINNNVFNRPEITGNDYYRLQKYQLFIGSIALSTQKFINTSLIYSYGRTEDIPYGYLIEADAGREINEFKWRTYFGARVAYGNIFNRFGYIYGGLSFSSFYNDRATEQGMLQLTVRYFTPLVHTGRSQLRTFVNLYYTRGFNRYSDEYLYFKSSNLVRGFVNDSINGNHRIVISVEPVLFTPKPVYGFRFALFTFADAGFLIKGNLGSGEYHNVTGFGLGVRIRNDQLVINTIQLRFGIYPSSPPWSETSWASVNGIVKLRPPGFEPGPPGVIPYR